MEHDENSPAAALAAQVSQHDDPRLVQALKENEALRKRLETQERANVVEGRFVGEIPRYFLNEACFLDDTWFAAGSVIEFVGIPNLSMAPQNDAAKVRMESQIRALEEGGRKVAIMRGREWTGLLTDRNLLIDTARIDAQAQANAPVPVIQMPQAHGMVPAMPHTEEAQAAARRGPGRPKKVVSSQPPGPVRPDNGAPMLAPAFPNLQPGGAIVGRMGSGSS